MHTLALPKSVFSFELGPLRHLALFELAFLNIYIYIYIYICIYVYIYVYICNIYMYIYIWSMRALRPPPFLRPPPWCPPNWVIEVSIVERSEP